MRGARPLTDKEIEGVLNSFKTLRDRTLFILGLKCGFRISEMLSLTWGDVMEHGTVGDYVTVQKKNTKGKIESKTLPLGPTIKEALRTYHESIRPTDLAQPLFKSSQSDKPITRAQAHNVLKDAFRSQKLTGNCRTHSLRKSYCQRIHKALGEKIELTQVAMCHKSLSSTQHYLEVDRERVEKAIVGLG